LAGIVDSRVVSFFGGHHGEAAPPTPKDEGEQGQRKEHKARPAPLVRAAQSSIGVLVLLVGLF